MKLRHYIIRRILMAIPVIIGVTLITFVLSNFVGNPYAAYVTNEQQLRNEAALEAIARKYHLNDPVFVRYLWYLWFLLQGDWGYSRAGHAPVLNVIMDRFPATFELTMVAMVFALGVGIPLGVISAVKSNKPIDHVSRFLALSGVSIPIFWLGLMLQILFYLIPQQLGLPYLPQEGRYDPLLLLSHNFRRYTGLMIIDSILNFDLAILLDSIAHLVLPSIALGYTSLATIVRLTRSSMLEVLRQDFMTLARAKGLPERVVIYKHALRNALIPTVTVAGLALAGLLGGAVLTETVFAWPGLGSWAVAAITRSDIAAIMGFTLMIAIIYTVANLAVDVLYGWLDPRIRLG
ncbi:MAG: ABC transporter permease [Candidatus Asgardarchaeia archaeon]